MTRLGELRPFQAILVIRALTNSWMTSSRMPQGEVVRSCIFGCSHVNSQDRLAHYGKCRVLWRFVSAVSRVDMASEDACTQTRLGITHDKDKLLAVALATHVYHSVRHVTIANSQQLFSSLKGALKAYCVLAKKPFVGVPVFHYVWWPDLFREGFHVSNTSQTENELVQIQTYVPGDPIQPEEPISSEAPGTSFEGTSGEGDQGTIQGNKE